MNIRSFAFVIGAASVLTLVACKSESSGTGGAGTGAAGGSSQVGGGGSGGSVACITCAETVTGGDPALLCSSSQALYDTLADCACNGACSAVCSANLCAGTMQDGPCTSCLQDTSANGCGTELNDCSNDL